MIIRLAIPAFACIAGIVIAAAVPSVPTAFRHLAGLAPVTAAEASPTSSTSAVDRLGAREKEGTEGHKEEGKIPMTAAQVAASGIVVAPAASGILVSRIAVPGILAANADKLGRVTARLAGTIAEVRRGLGDEVAKGDVLAVLESREISDAKGEFLAATRTAALAETTLARETRLWKQRISAEQEFLQSRASAEEARIKLDLSRQRLSSLGLSDEEVSALPRQPPANLRRLEIRAPIAGRITARAAVLGAAVGADTELFSVADLSTLWIEMAIPPRDLPMARQGQAVTIDGEAGAKGEGRVVFLSPVLDAETRSARAVAVLDNGSGAWRPGGFVTAHLATAEVPVDVLAPREAVQEVEGATIVFVRTAEGFEKREVALGREDAAGLEVIFGLDAGTEIAVGNVFALKAELGKSEAGHGH